MCVCFDVDYSANFQLIVVLADMRRVLLPSLQPLLHVRWFGLVADQNQARLRVSIARSVSVGTYMNAWSHSSCSFLAANAKHFLTWEKQLDSIWRRHVAMNIAVSTGNHLETMRVAWPVGLEKRSSSAMRPNQKIERELIERFDVRWRFSRGFYGDCWFAVWFLPSLQRMNMRLVQQRERKGQIMHLLFLKKDRSFYHTFFSVSLSRIIIAFLLFLFFKWHSTT